MGTSADIITNPFLSFLIGSFGGCVSTLCFSYLLGNLNDRGIHDTCGVLHLHGIPGLLGGVIGALVIGFSENDALGGYVENVVFRNKSHGEQSFAQLSVVLMTVCMSLVSGIICGWLLGLESIFGDSDNLFNDGKFWGVECDDQNRIRMMGLEDSQDEEERYSASTYGEVGEYGATNMIEEKRVVQ